MSELAPRLAELRARIATAARAAGRTPESVRLLAVSKTQGPERVRAAAEAGQRDFGENRVQEAEGKQDALADPALVWHLIGPLQRNKAQRAVERFNWIHSVDRLELVAALERAAASLGRRPRIFLQVNVDAEPQKHGCEIAALPELARAAAACAHLEWVGLMAIPRQSEAPEATRPAFARLRSLQEDLNRARRDAPLGELSMGMSADWEIAVQEGATWLRLGTSLFGERKTG